MCCELAYEEVLANRIRHDLAEVRSSRFVDIVGQVGSADMGSGEAFEITRLLNHLLQNFGFVRSGNQEYNLVSSV
ncbi:hypothetical protein FF011L_22420 [Roseimaritima multifibrata]|uniref:Uncharacterized protein n=1 Tax=Roseimaritima multifibrata TaxID=1930274 RepID=A0A517MF13_9BACT|nr:hypothetical protein FF011L_22420 [Roseimaritima multifibrata]